MLALGLTVLCASCGLSPWEQEGAGFASAEESTEHIFAAESATIGSWRDERESGIVINHGKLVLDAPRLETRAIGGRDAVVVTSVGPVLHQKVRDVLEDRIPVANGMTASFALGKTVSVKIERIRPDGGRTLIDEGRVSFLELVRR